MNPGPQPHRLPIASSASGRIGPRWLAAFALAVLFGCDGGGLQPDATRFGQIGSIHVLLETPLGLLAGGAGQELMPTGSLVQDLQWSSSGVWQLRETIAYRGLVGDDTVLRSAGEDPGFSAAAYAELINKIDGAPGLELFIPELPQDPDSSAVEPCGATRTRVTLTIRDDIRGQDARWVRCADGSLTNLSPEGAGPDATASRVVVTVLFARQGTVGDHHRSAYAGSVPFGTLDRGEHTPSGLRNPVVFTDEAAYRSFWNAHAPSVAPPPVTFPDEMVVVGVVGLRQEAGDSVEVRRIVQVDSGTQTEIFELVPGNFCSPASRPHVPFHVVVAPRLPDPQRFAQPTVREVPCG